MGRWCSGGVFLQPRVPLLLSLCNSFPFAGSAVGKIPAGNIARCVYATQAVRLSVCLECQSELQFQLCSICVFLGMALGSAFSRAL
jgi:hypothetical protein